jgi:hypothetical protein
MIMAFAFSCVYQAYMLYWFAYGFGRYVGFIESTWVKVVTLLGNMVRIPAMVSVQYSMTSTLRAGGWEEGDVWVWGSAPLLQQRSRRCCA